VNDSRRAVYFAHIPRTGGTSFITHVARHVDPARRYPSPALDDLFTAKASLPAALDLSPERVARTDFFCPHLPLAVTELLPGEFVTVTFVRDPVAVAVSALRMAMRSRAAGSTTTIEEFYDTDPLAHGWMAAHHLSWYLGATPDDLRALVALPVDIAGPDAFVKALDTPGEVIASEAALVASACRNVERIDALAFTDEPSEAYAAVERALGVPMPATPPQLNTTEDAPIPAALRKKLVAALESDCAVFEAAVDRIARRRTERSRRNFDLRGSS
jgi:hypothetical protein